jgi:phage terminase large subunit-like protein
MTAPNLRALDALAEQRAWSRGKLTWLMLAAQRKAYAALCASSHAVFVVLCSRRWGKTRFACLLVWMQALAHPGSIIRYAAPTKLHGRQFVQPAMRWLDKLAPKHLRPRFVSQDNTWIWPNGSVCHLGSCESDADVDAQVGTECHLAVIDEAGKVRSALLRKLVLSIMLPQFLTTRGKLCVLGTPADSPDHHFRQLVIQATERGTLVRHTIDDCTHVDAKALAEVVEELGGRDTTAARRELDCEFVTETSRALIPEWPAHRERIVRAVERPRYFDAYTIADTGFNDLTVVGFGYYWFGEGVFVLEDELVLRYHSGGAVGRAVLAKERALWGDKKPLRRWADASPQTLADMRDGSAKRDESGRVLEDGIVFAMAEKQDSVAALERLRNRIEHHQVIIHPRCVTTIAHLEYGIWNERKTDFERVEDPDGHHFDGVAMMKYAVRACIWGKNPAPIVEPYSREHAQVSPRILPEVQRQSALRKGKGDPFAAAFRRT